MKLNNILTGIKILEETVSPFNGKITVIKSLAFGTYFQVGGLTQSGGIIKRIWNKTLQKVSKVSNVPKVEKVLILGLGGGSIVEVVNKYWPNSKFTAVDIDKTIVRLGEEYLDLDSNKVKIVISDAEDFLVKKSKSPKNQNSKQIKNSKVKTKNTTNKSLTTHISQPIPKYDLILIDLYKGDDFPKKFEKISFLKNTKDVLNKNGIVVFNRLYYGEKIKESKKFGNTLEKIFSKVDIVYPEANVMFVCYK